MTNIAVLQNNVLIRYRIFTEFLKEHYLEIYVELCQNYADVMGKIYLNKFKSYIKDVEKLYVDLYDKKDVVFTEIVSNLRTQLNLKGIQGLDQEQRSLFYLMGRDQRVSALEQDPISYQVATNRQEKFTLESIFKSINRILLESMYNESNFTVDFFNLQPQ